MWGIQRRQNQQWTQVAHRCVQTLVLGAIAWICSCSTPCESISHRAIELRCDPVVGFSGEIHIDSRATFETFLRAQCLLPDDEVRIELALNAVDFSQEVVFIAVRPMSAGNGTCLLQRGLGDVEICDDGLNVIFADDDYADPSACPNGNWTIAFALSRDDMRKALRVAGDE